MIDRKLLKTNRWEDEEYLHARRTNALYNGGGGGTGGGGGDGGGERDGGDADLQSTTAHGGRNTSSRKGNLNFNFPGLPGMGGMFGGGGSSGGDVQSFLGSLKGSGITRKSRYKMSCSGPAGNGPRDLSLRCESISIPGQNIRSTPDALRFGPEREHAQGVTYGPISATFIVDKLQKEKAFFERWQNSVVDMNTWEPKYYNDYTGTVKIFQLDERNRATYGVELFEAYPKMINAQDMGHAQGNTYQTVTVEIIYHHWFPTYHGSAAGGSFGGMPSGINFNFALKFGGLSIKAALNLAKGGGDKDSKAHVNKVQDLLPRVEDGDGRGRGRVAHPNIYDHMKVRKPPPEGAPEAEVEPAGPGGGVDSGRSAGAGPF